VGLALFCSHPPVEVRGVENVITNRLFAMRLTRPVTSLATDIPLSDGLRVDVVIYGMTAVAERPSGALEIVRRIEGRPPVASIRYEIAAPSLMENVPLDWEREIIVTDFLEVALLPPAAVNESDIVLGKTKDWIRFRKIGDDGVGMFAGIAHYVGHAGLAPTRVDLLVTSLAGNRSNVVPVISWRRRG
jgi:hypothetical protein